MSKDFYQNTNKELNRLMNLAGIDRLSSSASTPIDIPSIKKYIIESLNDEKKRDVKYKGVNLEGEWEEAERYPDLKKLGKKRWILLGKTGKVVNWNELGNVDNYESDIKNLDPEKVERVSASIKRDEINYPIIGRWADGHLDLIAGNTRIALLKKLGHTPKIWLIDIPESDTEKSTIKEEENEDLKVAISLAKEIVKKGITSTKKVYSSLVDQLKKHGHDLYVAQNLADDALLTLNLTESANNEDLLDLAFLEYTKSSDKSSSTFDRIVGKYNIDPVEFEEYIKEKSKTESFLDRSAKFKKKL